MIFNSKQTKKFHIISMLVGIALIIVSSILYLKGYERIEDSNTQNNITFMMICTVLFVLGIIICITNFNTEDKRVITFLWIFFGVIIGGVIFNEQIRMGVILLAVTMVMFLFSMRFKNVFSTITTMTMTAVVFLIFGVVIQALFRDVNEMIFIYILISLFLVFYRFAGVKINQFYIGKVLGFKNEAKTYDVDQLVNQITLIYLLIFITLNIEGYSKGIAAEFFNLINNSFLTGITVTQINWKKIVFYFRKKEEVGREYDNNIFKS